MIPFTTRLPVNYVRIPMGSLGMWTGKKNIKQISMKNEIFIKQKTKKTINHERWPSRDNFTVYQKQSIPPIQMC